MPKRILQGVVVSDKQDKTVVVKVERRFLHPVMKKTVRRTKNYHAHDEKNAHKVGDAGADRGEAPPVEAEELGGGGRGRGESLKTRSRNAIRARSPVGRGLAPA